MGKTSALLLKEIQTAQEAKTVNDFRKKTKTFHLGFSSASLDRGQTVVHYLAIPSTGLVFPYVRKTVLVILNALGFNSIALRMTVKAKTIASAG